MCIFVGAVIPAAMLIGCAWLTCVQWIAAVSLFTVCVTFSGFFFSASFLSLLDVAPQFAGFLMGVSVAFSNFAKVAANVLQERVVVEVFTQDHHALMYYSR